MSQEKTGKASTYLNPVYDRSFPDPFVIKHRGEYFAISTGVAADGKVFPMLYSRNLVEWEEIGGAMSPLQEQHPHYWAPEITYIGGKFYLYYSVGDETLMQIRVAVSDRPDGGFVDAGYTMTNEEFAIDPHVHISSDGGVFMFYATDFLTHSHIGTGTVVDRMLDPFTLAGQPVPVTRARYDWQVYDPARKEKGGVRWHTVEGPFVIERKGRFFQMFSGGNWQNQTYGVSFAVSDSIDPGSEWEQFSDDTTTLPVLRTIPGRIIGPGHNSAVMGPNNLETYCIYHRWTESGRVLAIDRMDFASPYRLFISGPSDLPQPFPALPDRLTEDIAQTSRWRGMGGLWHELDSTIVSGGSERAEIILDEDLANDYICEINFKSLQKTGRFGITLLNGDTDVFTMLLDPAGNTAEAAWPGSGPRTFTLADHVDIASWNTMILETRSRSVRMTVANSLRFTADLPTPTTTLCLRADKSIVEFGPIDLTRGFEDTFLSAELQLSGWDLYGNTGDVAVRRDLLILTGEGDKTAVITKIVPVGDFEICLNIRVAEVRGDRAAFSLGCGITFELDVAADLRMTLSEQIIEVPEGFVPTEFNQLRLIRRNRNLELQWEGAALGSVSGEAGEFIRMSARDVSVEIDMIRFTAF